MVFSAISIGNALYFSTHCLARNKPAPKKEISINPKKNPKRKSRLNLENSSELHGGEAITYTRLPPKDDFFLPLLTNPISEVKLSETSLVEAPSFSTSSEESSDFEVENDGNSGKEGFDYGKFELFEVGSDSDCESEDEFDGFYDEGGESLDFGGIENSEGDENFEGIDVFEGEGGKEKEKGVPAVMRCFDRAKIYVKAGDGGNGVVAFRREKFVPLGGPSGGDGGRGGNVYVEVDGSMNSLLPFRQSVHFRASRGGHGHGRNQNGAKGEDVVVKVPPGTVVKEAAGRGGLQGDVLLELLHPGQRALLLPGGRGGRGNASFKTGMNKVPKIAENGEEGPEM